MWSGATSKRVAVQLRTFLEAVVQRPQYFVSNDDIQSGSLWDRVIAGELQSAHFGIACLARDNLPSTWIHFEAGAISKVNRDAIVVPYLIGIDSSEVKGPLTRFQSAPANRAGTLSLVESVNNAQAESDRTTSDALLTVFEALWSDFERIIREAMSAPAEVEPLRSQEDILREILIRLRGIEGQLRGSRRSAGSSDTTPSATTTEYLEAIRQYAFDKAQGSKWSRPEMYFREEDVAKNTMVPRELIYSMLDALRNNGMVACVNWRGDSVWMTSSGLKDSSTE